MGMAKNKRQPVTKSVKKGYKMTRKQGDFYKKVILRRTALGKISSRKEIVLTGKLIKREL